MNDPLITYLFPNPKKRRRGASAIFFYMLKMGVTYGHAYVTSSKMEGVILLFHSPGPQDRLISQIGHGLLTTAVKIGPKATRLSLEYDSFSMKIHKQIMTQPHLYLHTLGVDPDYQGRGHSSSLFRYIEQNLNPDDLPVYLETSNRENIAIYSRFGFTAISENAMPGHSEVDVFSMVKNPVS